MSSVIFGFITVFILFGIGTAHHTQVGYSVPVQSNIQPHIDKLENLIKKYGL